MRTEKEIRERIKKLDKLGREKFNPRSDKEASRILIKTYIRLGERYSLWWVLKEVKKFQGQKNDKSKK